ncbi:MAG: NFACT RNA binding domain-containing protein, partial [Syntrophomonadaceae bacterium]|nr:NFACT RNA binding domain-containing protein [Syntrophomonadaceae bacterium]
YSHEVSRHREVLPDRPYVAPPDQGKVDLLGMDGRGEELTRILLDRPWRGPVWRALFEKIEGLSPLLARELVCRSGLTPQTSIEECGAYEFDRLNQAVRWLQGTVLAGGFQPNLVAGNTPAAGELNLNTRLVEFAAVPLLQFTGEDYRVYCYESPSELLEACYRVRQLQNQWRGLYQELNRVIQASREKAFGKLALRQDSLKQIELAEGFKHWGDLIMTFLYRIKPGMEEIRVPDLYGSGEEISIPLSPQLTPIQNAQEYYRRYNRARRSQAAVRHYLEESRQEVEYLESVGQALTMAGTLQELQEIREELVEQGYLRAPSDRAKKVKKGGKPLKDKERGTEVSPARFLSSDGYEILVGKNNRQNDFLTMKLARKGDIWLHAKGLPGAHVVIRVRSRQPAAEGGDFPVPDRTLTEAAGLAAYFSRGRHTSKVSVDYTQRQNVRKPSGSPPGKVVYESYRTLLVSPQLLPEFQSE